MARPLFVLQEDLAEVFVPDFLFSKIPGLIFRHLPVKFFRIKLLSRLHRRLHDACSQPECPMPGKYVQVRIYADQEMLCDSVSVYTIFLASTRNLQHANDIL